MAICPTEIENCLVTYQSVADGAAIGVPHGENDKSVPAIVQPSRSFVACGELDEQLCQFASEAKDVGNITMKREYCYEVGREPDSELIVRALIYKLRTNAGCSRIEGSSAA